MVTVLWMITVLGMMTVHGHSPRGSDYQRMGNSNLEDDCPGDGVHSRDGGCPRDGACPKDDECPSDPNQQNLTDII